jgi:hypothetical protein
MIDCPHCGKPLNGLGRYCESCERYTDEEVAEQKAEAVRVGAPDTRPEEEIRRDVVKALRALNFQVWDTEQGYRRDGSTRVTKGFPDLIIAGHGRIIAVEMKSLKGKQTPEQEEFEAVWEENGGCYFVWRSLDEALAWARDVM